MVLPLILYGDVWIYAFRAGKPVSWDGSGQYTVASIYNKSIFPDTFGWTDVFFNGMPCPNFYPPLFYWGVAFLTHVHLASFDTVFKAASLIPSAILPALVFWLTWTLSDRRLLPSTLSGLWCALVLVEPRFTGSLVFATGIDYFSSIAVGTFTQPLGVAFLLVWLALYLSTTCIRRRFVLSVIALTCAILSNVFVALTAAFVIVATVLVNFAFVYPKTQRLFGTNNYEGRAQRKAIVAHIAGPILSLALTAFWLAPLISSYTFFVTSSAPFSPSPLPVIVFRLLALFGAWEWVRSGSAKRVAFSLSWLGMLLYVHLGALLTPSWFPLQANRLSGNIAIMTSVLSAVATASALGALKRVYPKAKTVFRPFEKSTGMACVFAAVFIALFMRYTDRQKSIRNLYEGSYFPAVVRPRWVNVSDDEVPLSVGSDQLKHLARVFGTGHRDVLNVLQFAKSHKDGRFAVQRAAFQDEAARDAQALASYLALDGNNSLYSTFRESSPLSLFAFPQIDAISLNTEMFGISSTLAEDLDFSSQPIGTHLERLQMFGVRYLAIFDQRIKYELDRETAVAARVDFGHWSVFTLRNPALEAEVLRWRPAIVFGDLSLKMRRTNEHGFLRLAEEQFKDNWFDVLLAYSQNLRVDDVLRDPAAFNRFGAVILERYDYNNINAALASLQEFSRHRPLILLPSDDPLFNRIRTNIRSFPMAMILNTTDGDDSGVWMQSRYSAHRRFGESPPHKEWMEIRQILEANKVPVPNAPSNLDAVHVEMTKSEIHLNLSEAKASSGEVPILLRTTYFPRWETDNPAPLYIASPFFTLIFSRGNTNLHYERHWIDRAGIWISFATVLVLIWIVSRKRPRANE